MKSSSVELSVIIVNYNTPDLTYRCVESVLEFTRGVSFEVILVDNGSRVVSPAQLAPMDPRVVRVRSEENLGFAGGNNLGVESSSGGLLLLLNSDTYIVDDCLSATYYWMEERPNIGALSLRLDFPDGRPQGAAQRWPGFRKTLTEGLRLQKVLPARHGRDYLLGAFATHQRTLEVDWIWGACFFLPRHVLDKLPEARLDDRFFMYAEDMLWCLQIQRLGYRVFYRPELRVYHEMGGSQGPKSAVMGENTNQVLAMVVPAWKRICLRLLARLTGLAPDF